MKKTSIPNPLFSDDNFYFRFNDIHIESFFIYFKSSKPINSSSCFLIINKCVCVCNLSEYHRHWIIISYKSESQARKHLVITYFSFLYFADQVSIPTIELDAYCKKASLAHKAETKISGTRLTQRRKQVIEWWRSESLIIILSPHHRRKLNGDLPLLILPCLLTTDKTHK